MIIGRPIFVLASGSPRRLTLINQIGIEPDALRPSDIDEMPLRGELPRACAPACAGQGRGGAGGAPSTTSLATSPAGRPWWRSAAGTCRSRSARRGWRSACGCCPAAIIAFTPSAW
jgi:hypothetical protein